MTRFRALIAMATALAVLATSEASASRRNYTLTGLKKSSEGAARTARGGDGEKAFADVIKDKVAISGLFTFYRDTTTNTLLMAIAKDQFDTVFLCNETRSQSEGVFYDNGSMGNSFPFYFTLVGKKVMMMEKNVRFRADTTSPFHRAVPSGLSDHLFGSAKLESKADSSGTVLVDASAFFIRDIGNTSFFIGQMGQTGVNFDRDNSYFGTVKSFPLNSEIAVRLHFRTSRPISAATMQNPYSFYHTYNYSLSTLQSTDYVPRLADDRLGNFLTLYQDYSTQADDDPYVRYVERWNLKKKNPEARVSEPVEPIVFWVENTWPAEYRDAVAEGIEFWNQSFEKLGFRNAIEARQMPDTASWDPADVRYSTVRFILVPGGGYAVGPSRANPYTGQIYDADVRIVSDFIRYMFTNMENYIGPVSFDGMVDGLYGMTDDSDPRATAAANNPRFCDYGAASARDAAFGLSYMLSTAVDFADKDSLTREYVHAYIVELVAHEVGHCLGLRHNFEASTIYTMDQINDRAFTREHGTCGTVMEYMPANIAGPGKTQGEFYASRPGPYDNWVIEYAYSDFGSKTPQEELDKLKEIASRSPQPGLQYSTDDEVFGYRSVNPLVNQFDLGTDPMAYAQHRMALSRELWSNGIKEFEKPGQRYQKLYDVFQFGWSAYSQAANLAGKYVGGLYFRRHHVGDPGGKIPFEVVPADQQRKAIEFINKNVFAADAFDLPADLHNKLAPELYQDFLWSSNSQIDYPFHQAVNAVYNTALNRLYSPMVVGRLLNNVVRVPRGADRYTMLDLFNDVRRGIWSELTAGTSVNSFRRQLQLMHLNKLLSIYLSNPAVYPSDARSLAANDLDIIEAAAGRVAAGGGDEMTRVHCKEVVRQIQAAKKAQREFIEG